MPKRTVRSAVDSRCGPETRECVMTLHEGIAAGDPVALESLYAHVFRALCHRLEHNFRCSSNDVLADAVEDAIVHYVLNPAAFDPSRGVPLDRYLYQASWRNAIDSLRADTQRRLREDAYAVSIRDQLRRCEAAESLRRRLIAVTVDKREAAALRCWIDGARGIAAVAAALGVSHLPSRYSVVK